jgi:hypothetical protein
VIRLLRVLFIFLLAATAGYSQVNISLYRQFNGRYDFTFVGNTLNLETNKNGNYDPPCTILTQSSAMLALTPGDAVHKAYLYWAGSGNGDYDVKLNGQEITAERSFPISVQNINQPLRYYFSAFADVTAIVQAAGSGTYTLSDLDLTALINQDTPPDDNLYCSNGTNFGGWVIVVIYKNDTLPLNQLNVYDGLQFVPNPVDITLNSINVIDNDGAKIGFVAWEGDASLNDGETLIFNDQELTNALNPPGNAFNSTNTVTGSSELFNMDLDVYDIEDNIEAGDTIAKIKLTSKADFVMISTIVTKLNSQLPDATVQVNNIVQRCNDSNITLNYTVSNVNSTAALPANTVVSVYAAGVYVASFKTAGTIPIGGSESGSILIVLPAGTPHDFELKLIADDLNGIALVTETDETNNIFTVPVSQWVSPPLSAIARVTACNEGGGTATFDFSGYGQSLKNNPTDTVRFYMDAASAEQGTGPILNTDAFVSATPQEIFVRLEDEHGCYSIGSFLLTTKICPPETYNYITPNYDGINDTFYVKGLRNIFLNFNLVWTGSHGTPDWDGVANEQKVGPDDKTVPTGTYYFVLELNDPAYPEPIVGWVYVTR